MRISNISVYSAIYNLVDVLHDHVKAPLLLLLTYGSLIVRRSSISFDTLPRYVQVENGRSCTGNLTGTETRGTQQM